MFLYKLIIFLTLSWYLGFRILFLKHYFVYLANSNNEEIEMIDENQNTNDELFADESSVRQMERDISLQTLNERRNYQKLSTEKRLLRRRFLLLLYQIFFFCF